MPIHGRELVKALQILADESDIRITVRSAAKGAAVCAASTFLGGILLGPRGLAAGGIIGGLIGYAMTEGDFRSLGDVLMNDLTDAQRKLLAEHIVAAVADFHISDVAKLVALMTSNASVREIVWSTVANFVTKELGMTIVA